jgi:hypothetical protein
MRDKRLGESGQRVSGIGPGAPTFGEEGACGGTSARLPNLEPIRASAHGETGRLVDDRRDRG